MTAHTSHSTPFWEACGAQSTGGGCVGPSLKCWFPPTSLTDGHLRDDRWRFYEVQSLIGTREKMPAGLKSMACCQISVLRCKLAKFQWISLLFCSISSAVVKNFCKKSLKANFKGTTQLVFDMSESFWSLQWRMVGLKSIDALRQQSVDNTASMGLSCPLLISSLESQDHPWIIQWSS